MSSPEDIRKGLRTLGLEPGAAPEDVRAAFRRLARDRHPDAGGGSSSLDFQRITAAYALLKNLTQEELRAPEPARRRTLSDWYQERRRQELQETEEREQEKVRRQRESRVDGILDRCEKGILRRLEQMGQEGDRRLVDGILSRMVSGLPEVRRLALERVGPLVNRDEVRQALSGLLCRWEVDEATARLLSGLPMTPATRRRLADSLSSRAAALPNSLLSSLLGLRDAAPDIALMERYLASASPAGVALILRYWPREGRAPADTTLRRLLENDDPEALVPVLSTMKQHFPEAAPRHSKRLAELGGHPAPAVRVWSQALLAS